MAAVSEAVAGKACSLKQISNFEWISPANTLTILPGEEDILGRPNIHML